MLEAKLDNLFDSGGRMESPSKRCPLTSICAVEHACIEVHTHAYIHTHDR